MNGLSEEAEEPEVDAFGAGVFDVVDSEVGVGEGFDLVAVFVGAADFDGVVIVDEEVTFGGGADWGIWRRMRLMLAPVMVDWVLSKKWNALHIFDSYKWITLLFYRKDGGKYEG